MSVLLICIRMAHANQALYVVFPMMVSCVYIHFIFHHLSPVFKTMCLRSFGKKKHKFSIT